MPEEKKKKSSCLIIAVVCAVVALGLIIVLGIIAAIAVPNLLNAIDRGKQKRTMADLRSIATAVESYAIDHNIYPTVSDMDTLKPHIEPKYLADCPVTDGWGHPIFYRPGEPEGMAYALVSPGKDGIVESQFTGGPTQNFDCDIVFVNGEFHQWPEGTQR